MRFVVVEAAATSSLAISADTFGLSSRAPASCPRYSGLISAPGEQSSEAACLVPHHKRYHHLHPSSFACAPPLSA